jgi:hypothetical protein
MSQLASIDASLIEHKGKIGNLDTIAPKTLLGKLDDKVESSALSVITDKIGNLDTIAPKTLLGKLDDKVELSALCVITDKIGNLDTLQSTTLLQKLADAEAAIATLSPINASVINSIIRDVARNVARTRGAYWLKSQEYGPLSNHPDNSNSRIVWSHQQESDPVFVQVCLRVYIGSDSIVYPLSTDRVQVRYTQLFSAAPVARYVQIDVPNKNFHVRYVKVMLRNGPTVVQAQPTVDLTNAIQNVTAVLFDDDTFASDISDLSDRPRRLTLDLKVMEGRVQRIVREVRHE